MVSSNPTPVNSGPLFIDLETYYASDYSLTNMTVEAYARDPRFRFHCLGYNDGGVRGASAVVPRENIHLTLQALDYSNRIVVGHNLTFDAFCIYHHFGLKPKFCIDTLAMSRWVKGRKYRRHNLDVITTALLGYSPKARVINEVKGVYDPPELMLLNLMHYCKVDVDKLVSLYKHLRPGYSKYALSLGDWAVQTYLNPVLELDTNLLASALAEETQRREQIVAATGVTTSVLRSRPKFAEALCNAGLIQSEIPVKVSPTTGKETYAFAKNDASFQELCEHPNPTIAGLCQAKLAVGSSIYPTRLERLRDISTRGPWPVFLNFCGAQNTARMSGGDGTNGQNLPRKGRIREAIQAPEGHKLIVVDSSNIEPRVLAELADSDALRRLLASGDPYKSMGGMIFRCTPDDIKKPSDERDLAKATVLGSGYGMGPPKFIYTVHVVWGMTQIERTTIIGAHQTYRQRFKKIPRFWSDCEMALRAIMNGTPFHLHDQVEVVPKEGILLKGIGFMLKYPNLNYTADGFKYGPNGDEYKIYGAKVTENLCQGLAGGIIGTQLRQVRALDWNVALQVHDELVVCAPVNRAEQCLHDVTRIMSTSPPWWPEIALAAEGSIVDRYSEAK